MGARKFKTYDAAREFMDRYIAERGYDREAVYSWLVVDEDYEDGCQFTEQQLIREIDASWKLEMRSRVISKYMDGPHVTQVNDAQRRGIARHLALNWEGIEVNLKTALSLSLPDIHSIPVR